MLRTVTAVIIVLSSFIISQPIQAALVDRGGGLVYDEDEDLTWLQDGGMIWEILGPGDLYSWNDLMTWVEGFEYYDSVRDTTWTDWRFPYINELDHLYDDEVIRAGATSGPFTRVETGESGSSVGVGFYWSTEAYSGGGAWFYNFAGSELGGAVGSGEWGHVAGVFNEQIWPVRVGDVGLAPPPPSVPEPSTIILLGAGLLGVAGLARRRQS